MQQLVCPLDEALTFANEISGNAARITEADFLDATLQGYIGVWAEFGNQFSALDGELISRADAGLVRKKCVVQRVLHCWVIRRPQSFTKTAIRSASDSL